MWSSREGGLREGSSVRCLAAQKVRMREAIGPTKHAVARQMTCDVCCMQYR